MIDVKKVAALARLTITPEEEVTYGKQLGAILEHFRELSAVKTDGIEPLVTPTQIEQKWRQDEGQKGMGAEAALANAPEVSGHLVKVPPVV